MPVCQAAIDSGNVGDGMAVVIFQSVVVNYD